MTVPETEILDTGATKYILFKTQDYVGRILRAKGVYEPELQYASKLLVGSTPPGLVLDVGANIGTYAIPLAQALPQYRIVCFEVQRVVHDQLSKNIALNGLTNITALCEGLSDVTEKIAVSLPDYATESNIMAFSLDDEVRAHDYECASIGETDTVSVAPLDSFHYADIRLIKIDVEGLELKVLRGAAQTLARNGYPPLIFEAWTAKPWFEDRRRELLAYVRTLGYEIVEVLNNVIAQHPAYPTQVEFNVRKT